MERGAKRNNDRSLENRVISSIKVSDFLGHLTPEEFDVLWDMTGGHTINMIAQINGFSTSQVNTIRQSLARKSKLLR